MKKIVVLVFILAMQLTRKAAIAEGDFSLNGNFSLATTDLNQAGQTVQFSNGAFIGLHYIWYPRHD